MSVHFSYKYREQSCFYSLQYGAGHISLCLFFAGVMQRHRPGGKPKVGGKLYFLHRYLKLTRNSKRIWSGLNRLDLKIGTDDCWISESMLTTSYGGSTVDLPWGAAPLVGIPTKCYLNYRAIAEQLDKKPAFWTSPWSGRSSMQHS